VVVRRTLPEKGWVLGIMARKLTGSEPVGKRIRNGGECAGQLFLTEEV